MVEQVGGVLPEHPDPAGVLQQEQADAVGEQRRILAPRRPRIQAQGQQRFFAGRQRLVQSRVQPLI
jgi:hypothetical protein